MGIPNYCLPLGLQRSLGPSAGFGYDIIRSAITMGKVFSTNGWSVNFGILIFPIYVTPETIGNDL